MHTNTYIHTYTCMCVHLRTYSYSDTTDQWLPLKKKIRLKWTHVFLHPARRSKTHPLGKAGIYDLYVYIIHIYYMYKLYLYIFYFVTTHQRLSYWRSWCTCMYA